MNYLELRTLVAETAHRSDLSGNIPGFIAQAEALIASRVESRYMETSVTLSDLDRSGTSVVYSLPNDFLSARSIATVGVPSNQRRTELRSLGFAESTFISHLPAETTNLVGYFLTGADTPSDRKMLIFPAPALGVEISVSYFAIPAPLINDSDTTRLLTNQGDLYLYGALKYLAVFIQDIDMYQLYDRLFSDITTSDNDQTKKYYNLGAAQMQGASAWV